MLNYSVITYLVKKESNNYYQTEFLESYIDKIQLLLMVEKTKKKKTEEEKIDFYINASDITDITLTEEESEKLIEMLNRGPNKKAKNNTREALKFYDEMVQRTE
jgi:CRISPR/Cas system-associated exonuclease Cas4 (RecB family)